MHAGLHARSRFSVSVLVMQIRVMRMGMENWVVRVPMRVWLARRVRVAMLMLMMQVVEMAVLMILRQMAMTVRMTLNEVKPEANRHQDSGDNKARVYRLR